MVTKNEGDRENTLIQVLSGIVAIEGYLPFERAVNNLFPFPPIPAKLIGDVSTNRQSAANFRKNFSFS